MFMKHKKLYFLLLISLLFGMSAISQNAILINKQEAIIEYRAEIQQRYVDSFVKSVNNKKDVAMDIKQRVTYNFKNADPDFFTLKINGNESYYSQSKTLDLIGEYNMGSRAPKHDFYTKADKDFIVEFSPYFGKIKMNPLDWTIVTSVTRDIGGYICYQATAKQKLYSRQGHYYYKDIIAWFTPEIPLPFGPSNFNGLPGLVLELERDMFIISATKIILHPDDEVKINAVDENDKMITEEESHRRIGGVESEVKEKYKDEGR